MHQFDIYSSNSIAGSGNQFYFTMQENEIRTGRVFYRITHGGTYRYSLLFSNIIDTTYSDGKISQKNLLCKPWKIHSAKIGRFGVDFFAEDATKCCDTPNDAWKTILFDGNTVKSVASGECFWSDPTEFTFEANEYLCLEITFSGTMIPYHEESLLPAFIKNGATWNYDKRVPFVGMIGCDRTVKHKLAFWGDSITQGIGTPNNSYLHWNALVAQKLGLDYACWNLGIGYARANDAATLGAWWNKAKHNDIVVLCLGANDILQNMPEEQIKHDIDTIAKTLKANGCRVVIQTVPPFEYTDSQIKTWKNINQYICQTIAKSVDLLFDVVPFLSYGEPNHLPIYGGHPDKKGCAIWAEKLYQALDHIL